MGVCWASCPICGKFFERYYDPRTGVNSAERSVRSHVLKAHGLILRDGEIIEPQSLEDIAKVELKVYRVSSNPKSSTVDAYKVESYIYCRICEKSFRVIKIIPYNDTYIRGNTEYHKSDLPLKEYIKQIHNKHILEHFQKHPEFLHLAESYTLVHETTPRRR